MAKVAREIRDGVPTGQWLARWRDDENVQRKKSFGRKADAERYLRGIAADLDRGTYVDPTEKTTVGEFARQWLDARAVGARTRSRLDSMIANHIEGVALGGRRLSAVRPSEVQAWVSDRTKVLAPSTLRKLVSVLRAVYAAAVLDRLVGSSPVVGLTMPSASKERVVPLSVDQVRALAAAMAALYRTMVVVQAGLGLRLGELLALRVEDVNFLRRTVRVEHQIAPKTLAREAPKTPRSRRTIPLPQLVAEALAEHLAAFPPAEEGLIFHTKTGRPFDHDFYGGRVFPRAVAAANRATVEQCEHCDAEAWVIEPAGRRVSPPQRCWHPGELPEDTTSHDLRHHFASVLLQAGESVVAVAEWLGHEDATMVLRVYGHLMSNSEDRMRRAIDAAWTESPDGATAGKQSDEAASGATHVPRAITGGV